MRYYKYIVMIVFVMLLGFTNWANGSSTAREAVRSIQELNTIRNALSLPPFHSNKELDEAALTHNRYMNYSNVLSSIEDPGKTYYRGRYPWDRAGYAGYNKSYVTEMVGKGYNNFTEGWQTFIADPYLRYNFLNPNYTDVGMDRYNDYTTYLFGGNMAENDYEVIYPYAQQTNVPVNNSFYYSKNPYQQLQQSQQQRQDYKGFPLTYTYYSNKSVEKFDIKEISLIRLNTYQNIPISYSTTQLTNSIIILPHVDFEHFSSYQLTLRMTLTLSDGKKVYVNKNTNFTTESANQKKKTSGVKYLTRVDFVKKLLQTLKYDIKSSLGIIFKDVSPSSVDYKYIYTAYSEKLVMGTPNGEFLPMANIKEQDAIVVLIRAYEKKRGQIKLTAQDQILFRQDVRAEYAIDPLRKAVKIGLIDANRESFDPNHYLTVAEFDEILKRYESGIK
ncbi:MAG: S-layer homology domain-containing protein [Eubacteriales bacterium]|nr:S-layer homology domain-containing protein [Eubacteriales bacterium]